jgi:Xaa-Pro aminopeptidase
VRGNAAQAGFDCIFVPQCVDGRNLNLSLEQSRGTSSDGRYLTLLDNAAVVLPTDGQPPLVITDRGDGRPWIEDARPPGRGAWNSWSDAMADALLEVGMERARIGVSGLARGRMTHGRANAGVVNHSSYAEVLRRLPNATFADATDVVGLARYIKSDEEIEALRRGAEIATAGIEEMVAAARPGVPEAEVYARVMVRMMELGSEYYPLAWSTNPIGGPRPRFENPDPDRVLGPNYLITNETDAVWGGLIAQEMQPIVLGAIPEDWKPVVALQRELFEMGLEALTPGTTFGQLIDLINGHGAKQGMHSSILLHGRGYGDDGPLLVFDAPTPAVRDVVVEKNTTFVWKPIAHNAERSIQFSWGGCVVVTERGAQQLVPRTPGLASIT